MIDWKTIKPLIKNQVSDLCELPLDAVRWVDEPSGPLAGVQPVAYLRVTSIVSIGDEEVFYEETNAGDDQKVTIKAQIDFTLSLRFESFTQDIADPRHAANLSERFKRRIWRSSAMEERTNNFAFTNYLATKWFNFVDKGGRPICTYIVDFRCATHDSDVDTTIDAGSYIARALVASKTANGDPGLFDAAGVPTASQVDLDINSEE